jgi:hypothetical protein
MHFATQREGTAEVFLHTAAIWGGICREMSQQYLRSAPDDANLNWMRAEFSGCGRLIAACGVSKGRALAWFLV